MPKIKTADLTGAALDWAVAVAEGESPIYTRHWVIPSHPEDPRRVCILNFQGYRQPYEPSQWWGIGGPIIEREIIHTWTDRKDAAYLGHPDDIWVAATASDMSPLLWGSTPLIAAMRCYCCSKLGDVVDIPEELCQQQKS